MDVDTIRSGLEAYRNGLELDRYELDRGLREESEARAIRRSYAELFGSDVRDMVASSIGKSEERGLAGDAKSYRILYAGLARLHVQRELDPIDSAIARHGRVVKIELSDGTRRPLRDLKLLLATTDDPEARGELDQARVEQARILVPLMTEKVEIEAGIAQSLGAGDLVELMDSISGFEVARVEALAEQLLSETDELYREVMGWSVRKRLGLPLEDARSCDIPYVLAGRYRDYKDAFSAADMVKRTKLFLERMGVDLTADGRLTVEVEHVEPPRAYVGPIKVPTDVRLVLEIKDGQRDWLTFLNALGRALFYAHVDPQAPFEQRALGDPSLPLAYGQVFSNLLLDRDWLVHSLEFRRPKDYLVLAWLERLYDLRLTCARVLHDVALRRRASAEGMEEAFEQTMRRAIGVKTPSELFLHDVRTGLHSVIQLRARLFEPLLTLHLHHYFDETWWRNPSCGPFLQRTWGQGFLESVEAMAEDMGQELSSKHLLKLFSKNL